MRPLINWYPGHIAKAERALQDSVKAVDVVIEVRDSRAPISTAHPSVPTWVGNRAHVVALSKADLCAEVARRDWKLYLKDIDIQARFVDARRGRGVSELKKLAIDAGGGINEKRRARGLLPRPVRCLVAGYPNVGKSALINRLVGRRAAKSANKPGVTRGFQWIRIADDIELLDMPGIIPMRLGDQTTALRLAMCDDIGHGAYDPQIVAAKMIDELKRVVDEEPDGYFDISTLEKRFKVSTKDISGEEFLYRAADECHKGDVQRTAVRLFTEFRGGDLGLVSLEPPPKASSPP